MIRYRLSERRFYQKVTDIYATSVDYDKKSPTTIKFFKRVQNKMHYAVSHQTAAEIIYNRANSEKENMAATNYTVIVKNKKTERIVLIDLTSKWTYKQALAIAKETHAKNDTHELVCVIETNKILLKNEKENEKNCAL